MHGKWTSERWRGSCSQNARGAHAKTASLLPVDLLRANVRGTRARAPCLKRPALHTYNCCT
eukprot:6306910-Pyramimonas_sp.AAC.1